MNKQFYHYLAKMKALCAEIEPLAASYEDKKRAAELAKTLLDQKVSKLASLKDDFYGDLLNGCLEQNSDIQIDEYHNGAYTVCVEQRQKDNPPTSK